MGDFWQCERGDFVLIQIKDQVLKGVSMPFIVAGKDAAMLTTVKELQNKYSDITGQEMTPNCLPH